jgi:hypothetical protein
MFRSKSTPTGMNDSLTVRPATPEDALALVRLAQLDDAPVPGGELIVAEVRGELVAAVPAGGGRAIADPFRPTADVVSLLELRAAQVAAEQPARPLGGPAAARA